MQLNKIVKFKKNSKFIRLNNLYFDLLKTKHMLNFFIGGIKKRQLLQIYKVVSARQSFLNFLTKLECRLEFILLKSGFVLTGRQAKQLILHSHILINGKKIKSCFVELKINDCVSLSNAYIRQYKQILVCNLLTTSFFLKFLKKKRINKKFTVQKLFGHFKFPLFLEVNFRTFTIFLIKKPLLQEFFFPKAVSLYDCNQLRFIL